ncbi:MAG: glycerol-3-phosphate dehydrogenase/oxidase [Planctomycetota bacterium]
MASADWRQLEEGTYDLLVIGGGINGAGLARDAAERGLRVALVERSDFSSGTSSRSSRLVHGGIRYLEQADFRLVHEACRERRLLLDLAPHLVRPLPFLLPIYEGDARGPMWIRLGMWLYDLMAAFRNTKRHQMLSTREVLEREPDLLADGLRAGALYYDAKMDDARLCLLTFRAAAHAGAHLVNFASAREILVENGRASGALVQPAGGGEPVTVRARVVVSTCGPWAGLMPELEPSGEPPRLRPTKGVHLLVPALTRHSGIVLSARRDGRVYFVIPHGDLSIVGTTDTDYSGPPDAVDIDAADARYLLEETRRVLPGARLEPSDVVATYAGVRPLLDQRGVGPSGVSREHQILETSTGALILVGGKYTTFRAVCAELTERVFRSLGQKAPSGKTAREAIPGGDVSDFPRWRSGVVAKWTEELGIGRRAAERIIDGHGTLAQEHEELIRREPAAREPLGPDDGALLGVEVAHAVRFEWCQRLVDLFRTRTSRLFDPGSGQGEWEGAADWMARELGWGAERRSRELQALRAERDRMFDWRDSSSG